jgi:uncharacterized protein YlxW (UPF0749 family)
MTNTAQTEPLSLLDGVEPDVKVGCISAVLDGRCYISSSSFFESNAVMSGALKDSKRQFETDASDRINTLTQQLSDTQRQNAELKESIAQKNSDISSWVERDFANQRKIADLMQRVGEAEYRIDELMLEYCPDAMFRGTVG